VVEAADIAREFSLRELGNDVVIFVL
jgi:hypothetical protein